MARIIELEKRLWPQRILEIPEPPKRLYIRGAVPDWNNRFLCVVGARKHTDYGKEVCETLISGLKGYPITIISGLALGIDAIAHRAALTAGLHTIAIPGSGLHPGVLYPSTNRGLGDDILKAHGTLLSEFEPTFQATPYSFPQRNRIMAGLSHAVLIIEAEIRSGTLITSRLATEYNRDVCTVPGSIFSKTSEGPHMLLRLGATPITNSRELLEVLGFEVEDTRTEKYKDCSPAEKSIIGILREPQSRDTLFEKLHLSAREANALLTILEIKGLVKENLGELYLT